VIFGLIIFVSLVIVRGLYLIAQHIDQQNYERRRFHLMVAAGARPWGETRQDPSEGNQQNDPETSNSLLA
jgi:hypothetical protein